MTEHPDQAPAQPVPPSVWRNPWHFLAFGFGSGTLPKAPGTWGSLVAIPFIPLWQMLPDWGYWLMLGVTMLFGFWLCGKVADDLRVHDHEGIVWDEMVGMWITLWLVVAADRLRRVPHRGYSQTLADQLGGPQRARGRRDHARRRPGRGIRLAGHAGSSLGMGTLAGLRPPMRLLVLFCCLWLLPGVASAEPSVGEIRVVSETWTRYTQEDGRGVAWDLLRAVYEPAGVRLRIANEPYTRAVGLVLRGEADAWVGAYRGEIDEALYPRWPYDVDPIAVLSLKDNPPPPLEGLSRFRLSWMRGYAFARYFPTLTPHSELQRRTSALPMLLNHRVDYFIDSRPELEEMLAGAGALAAEYRITDVTRLPLYLGFSDSPRGRELLALFDRRMRQLHASGELERIFARWNWPYAPLKAILPPKE